MTAVRRATDSGPGDSGPGASGTTSMVAWSGPPTGRTVMRSRPDGRRARQSARSPRSGGGRSLPYTSLVLAARRARCASRLLVWPAVTLREVNTPAVGRGSRSAGGPATPASSRLPTALISGLALMRHSAYSSSGDESATMPPPTPSQTVPGLPGFAANSNVLMATLSSSPATGLR